MTRRIPVSLRRLLAARTDFERDERWGDFVSEFSRLIQMTARRSTADHDDAMDRYTYILDALRSDGFARLRRYDEGGRSRFSTWLVVVCSRLCVDHHRSRYGRAPGSGSDSPLRRRRRRIVDLLGEAVDTDGLVDGGMPSPAAMAEREERRRVVAELVAGLPEDDRLLLYLRFEEDLPMTEASRLCGHSSQFVGHRRMKAVLARLRQELERRGIGRRDL